MNAVVIANIDDLRDLDAEAAKAALRGEEARQGESFVLWRGVKDASYELMSSLQVRLWKKHNKRDTWKSEIRAKERELVDRFLDEIEPNDELQTQYTWFRRHSERNNTFSYLSVMQHYGAPTRLVDFTADLWTALFFGSDSASHGKDILLLALRCRNEDANDQGGNKLPRDNSGNPWRVADGKVNINDFLGNVIGYKGFEHSRFENNPAWSSPRQAFGWDRPAFPNARISKQRGFFVYPVDVRNALEEVLSGESAFTKYVIRGSLRETILTELRSRGLNNWAVYLDLPRAFASFDP